MIVDFVVDVKCNVLFTDHDFTGPVFIIEILCTHYTECLICVHPSEKDSAVECDKGKGGADRLPSKGSTYLVEINPSTGSGYKNNTINIKDWQHFPEFWSGPFVITLTRHYIFINEHLRFSVIKLKYFD